MFCPLAANRNCVAASRTWPIVPGADWNLSEKTVWTESIDHERGLEARDLFEDALDARLGQQVERRVADAEPLAAALDLVLRFLARRVEHRPDFAREVRGRLEQQRRLADARLAAEQHQRPRHDAAAEHAIELADAGRQPRRRQPSRPRRRAAPSDRLPARVSAAPSGGTGLRGALLRQRVPGAALGAPPEPLGRLGAAFLADEEDLGGFMAPRPRESSTRHPDSDTADACPSASATSRMTPCLCVTRRLCGLPLDPRPRRHTTSHGIVPMAAAISRASICCHASSPWRPRITTSSPGSTTSRPVTSTVIMSIDTAPTIGARRPRMSTCPRPESRVSRPSA